MVEGLVLGSVESPELFPGFLQGVETGFLELRHLDEDRGVVPEGPEKGFVLLGENPFRLVEELDGSQGPPGSIIDRHAEHAPRSKAGACIYLLVESWIPVRILQIDGLPGLKAESGQSNIGWNTNHLPVQVQGHSGPELICIRVMKKDATTVRPHDLGGLLDDLPEHPSDLEIQADELAKFQ